MNKIIIALVAAIIIASGFISCKKGSDSSPSSSIAPTITSGSWRVSYFFDKTKDETSDFMPFTFTFLTGGQLTASSPAGIVNGTWSEINDDDKGGSHKLVLSIGTSSPLNNLNHNWLITAQSSTKIELKDDSNNNEILHFSKK